MAASGVGSCAFSRPVVTPRLEVIVAVAGAPGIWATVRTLPTRSTTAIVAGGPRAFASLMACKTIVLTSASVKEVLGCPTVGDGAGPLLPPPPPPPPPQLEGAAQSSESIAIAALKAGLANRPRGDCA